MSHATSGVTGRQPDCTCRALVRQPGLPFAAHVSQEQIHQALAQSGVPFRERLFTPAVTLWTFLTQVLDPDHSCRQAVARLLAFRTAQGLAPCSPDTGAYCKARGRFPEEALAGLVRATGQGLLDKAGGQWLWKGRRVKVVDGTGLSMPDTPANQIAYPQSEKILPGVGFPLMRLVVVFSLAVGTVLDAALGRFQGQGTGEVSLFRTPDDALDPGDVLLADRLYANYWDVTRLAGRGVDVVMRLHAGRAKPWFRGRGHSKANKRVWWRKPARPARMSAADYDAYPEWIRLRVVRVDVRQRGFRTRRLLLVTTLGDAAAYAAEDLADLYRRRWQAELNLRSLKTTLQMDILRGRSPATVRKEVWAHLLVYNVVRGLMAQAAAACAVDPDELSFAGALQTLNAFLPPLRTARTAAEVSRLEAVMLEAIGTHRVGGRPDRVEPRVVTEYCAAKEPYDNRRGRLT